MMARGIEQAKKATRSGDFDLISYDDIEDLIDNKNELTELILTGRNAPEKLIEKADLVTEMKEIKHYYKKGVMAKRGIES